jgi:hypothetical protein
MEVESFLVYPEARLAPVTVLVGRGKPVGAADALTSSELPRGSGEPARRLAQLMIV